MGRPQHCLASGAGSGEVQYGTGGCQGKQRSKGRARQAQSSKGRAVPPAPVEQRGSAKPSSLGARCQPLPAPWPPCPARGEPGALPLTGAQASTAVTLPAVFLKREQLLWVPLVAQELHRSSWQGLGKQKGSWL